MKYIFCLILTILLSGCVEKVVYVEPSIPKPIEKPIFNEYNFSVMEINGVQYYVLQLHDANILALNWISYRRWCEANYSILNLQYNKYNKTKKENK